MREEIAKYAANIRTESLKMVHRAKASHIGGALSMADLLAVLYGQAMNINPESPRSPGRDRFILSKGHSTVGLYATLALRGFFPVSELQTYGQDGSRLLAHVSHKVPGVEFSTGSLGHGLPFAVGKALAAKRQGHSWRVFAMLSDGELDEGSNWEAILFAAHHRLDNLVVVVDYNKIQSMGSVEEVIRLEPLAQKLHAFNWNVREIDGHNLNQIVDALRPTDKLMPTIVIANTIKGKGVPFMEGKLLWHYRSPTDIELSEAVEAIGATR